MDVRREAIVKNNSHGIAPGEIGGSQQTLSSSLNLLYTADLSPLKGVVQMHARLLAALAQLWLDFGAEAFIIWQDDVLFCQPSSLKSSIENGEGANAICWTPIKVAEQEIGKMGILGLDAPPSPALLARMAAEADLIAQLVALTLELTEARDKLIAHERLKLEMGLAASIQLRLLSHAFPCVSGLDIFARSLPAEQVGGDFYGFHARPHGPFVFITGDVSGKGLPAALLMAMTRTVLDGASRFMPHVHPKALLNRVSEDLYDDFTDLGMFATIFTGCYNPDSRELSFANAGHSPVIYCPAGGNARLLEADGPAAGVLPVNLSENFTCTFHPGDVLVIATDGFSEAFNAENEPFGYDRLINLVEHYASCSAEEITAILFAQVRLFADGCEQSDDQTLVVLKGIQS